MSAADSLPSSIKDQFEVLWKDVVWVNWLWQMFVDLYGDPDTVSVLNYRSGRFFGSIQGVLRDQVFLDIARLLDPAESGPASNRRENLTLASLIDVIPPEEDALRKKLRRMHERLVQSTAGIRDMRNKLIAHRDRAIALSTAEVLRPGTISEIREAVEQIGAIMNAVATHFGGGHTGFNLPHYGVSTLLGQLRTAKEYDEARRASRPTTEPRQDSRKGRNLDF